MGASAQEGECTMVPFAVRRHLLAAAAVGLATLAVGGGAEPWLVEDFTSYQGSTARWRANPHGWRVGTGTRWFHQQKIFLDTLELYEGHPTLRYEWPGPAEPRWGGCRTDPAIVASYQAPEAREIWVEVVHKFRRDWNNRGPGCKFGEYKFLLLWRKSDRFGIGNGHDGATWWSASPQSPVFPGYEPYCSTEGAGESCRWGYGQGQEQYRGSVPDRHWDGKWHVYRLHIRIPAVKGDTDGVYEIWVDGVQTVGRYGRTFINNRSGEFTGRVTEIMLGSNSNSGTLVPTQTWWGHLKIWTSSPGW